MKAWKFRYISFSLRLPAETLLLDDAKSPPDDVSTPPLDLLSLLLLIKKLLGCIGSVVQKEEKERDAGRKKSARRLFLASRQTAPVCISSPRSRESSKVVKKTNEIWTLTSAWPNLPYPCSSSQQQSPSRSDDSAARRKRPSLCSN